MGVMDTVMGGVGTGIQPKDNPNPVAPGPSAGTQTALNSMPPPSPTPAPGAASAPQAAGQPAPAPQPSPTPAPQGQPQADQDVDALFSDFQKQPLPKDALDHKAKLQGEVDDLFKDFNSGSENGPIVDQRKPDESPWAYAMRSLPEQAQFVAAQMRAHLGRDPKEQRQAFESMYGPDNVKTQAGSLYFRPDAESTFRKVDQTLYNGVVDFALFHALQAPGLLANVATQGATDAVTGATGPAGFAVGGGAGGAMQSGVDNTMRGALNSVSSMPQESKPQSPWMHVASDVANESGLNAVGAGFLGPVFGAIGKAYFGKLQNSLINSSGEDVQQLASVRTFFNQFKDAVFPSVGEDTGPKVMNAVDAIHDRLGKQVGAIKQEALGLAESTDQKVAMENTIQKLQDTLQKNGYPLDDMGFAKMAPQAPGQPAQVLGNQELLSSPYRNSLDQLANFMNRLKRDAIANQGSDLSQVFQDMDNLSRLSKFDAASPTNPEIIGMFRNVRNAASTDRNAFLNKLYSGSQSPNASVWQDTYKEYSSNIDALTDLRAAFRSPQQRELMINALNKSSSTDKLELLDNFKQVLGESSKEWGAVRGDIYSQIIDNHIGDDGVFNAARFASYLTTKGNQPFLSRLLTKQDQGILVKGALEAAQINANNSLTKASANGLTEFAGRIIDWMGASSGVKALFKLSSGNAKVINYLTDDGFMNAYERAAGPELKQNILDARRLMAGVRDKMTLIGDTPLGKAAGKGQRYVPLAATGSSFAFDSFFPGFNPQRAAPSPMPLPTPTPQNAPGVATGQ